MTIRVWKGIQLQQLAFTFQSEVIDSAVCGNFLFVTCLGRNHSFFWIAHAGIVNTWHWTLGIGILIAKWCVQHTE